MWVLQPGGGDDLAIEAPTFTPAWLRRKHLHNDVSVQRLIARRIRRTCRRRRAPSTVYRSERLLKLIA
jgi:hypothetical protein